MICAVYMLLCKFVLLVACEWLLEIYLLSIFFRFFSCAVTVICVKNWILFYHVLSPSFTKKNNEKVSPGGPSSHVWSDCRTNTQGCHLAASVEISIISQSLWQAFCLLSPARIGHFGMYMCIVYCSNMSAPLPKIQVNTQYKLSSLPRQSLFDTFRFSWASSCCIARNNPHEGVLFDHGRPCPPWSETGQTLRINANDNGWQKDWNLGLWHLLTLKHGHLFQQTRPIEVKVWSTVTPQVNCFTLSSKKALRGTQQQGHTTEHPKEQLHFCSEPCEEVFPFPPPQLTRLLVPNLAITW